MKSYVCIRIITVHIPVMDEDLEIKLVMLSGRKLVFDVSVMVPTDCYELKCIILC